AIALTAAPIVLLAFGWRTLWSWNAVLLVVLGIGLTVVRLPRGAGGETVVKLDALVRTIRHRDMWLLALIFACYTFQFIAAIAVIANAGGNLAASWLVARRVAPSRLMAVALAVMAACVLGIYFSAMPPDGRYGLAIVFSAFGGLLPAAVFATIPSVAGRTGSGAIVMGLVVQASHIGQLTGPPTVAAIAEATGGWESSPLA